MDPLPPGQVSDMYIVFDNNPLASINKIRVYRGQWNEQPIPLEVR